MSARVRGNSGVDDDAMSMFPVTSANSEAFKDGALIRGIDIPKELSGKGEAATIDGVLMKKGKLRWKGQYFRVEGSVMKMFEDENSREADEIVDLTQVQLASPETKDYQYKYAVALAQGDTELWVLGFETGTLKEKWSGAMNGTGSGGTNPMQAQANPMLSTPKTVDGSKPNAAAKPNPSGWDDARGPPPPPPVGWRRVAAITSRRSARSRTRTSCARRMNV